MTVNSANLCEMLFSDVLDIHDSFKSQNGHSDILGDGYLLQSNSIYRNVKEFSVKIGAEYVEACAEYLMLPFHQLPKITGQRKIPYIPGARLMKNVERDHPGVFATEDMPMPESYHLHEAAHVIAEHFLKEVRLSNARETILKLIMAESFANAVDALACVPAADDIHRFFLKQNCYMHPRKNVSHALAALIESAGFRFTFMLTFFTYVHANFLTRPVSMKMIRELLERYAPEVNLGAKLQKHIQTVRGMGENLDPLFRVTTTGNYLKQQGFEGDIQDLLDFPFLTVFAGNPGFRKAAEAMGDTLMGGT